MSTFSRPYARAENLVWDVNTLAWVAMTQPGGGPGGAVEVSNWPSVQDTQEGRSTTASVASKTGSGAAQTLAAANGSRVGLAVYNASGVVVYLKLGADASAADYTVKLIDGAYFELPFPMYTGIVTALWASGSLLVTEY